MIVIVKKICATQVPCHTGTIDMCVHIITLTAVPQSCHDHDDCNRVLQRYKVVEEQMETQTFWPILEETQKKHKCFVFTFSSCVPHLFFGLYLLYVYIKQFQIL